MKTEGSHAFAGIPRREPKPGVSKGFVEAGNDEIDPIMKNIAGFAGQGPAISRDGKEAFGIGQWDCKENAETCRQERCVGVLKTLEKHTDGKPHLQTYEVTNTTYGTLSGRKAA